METVMEAHPAVGHVSGALFLKTQEEKTNCGHVNTVQREAKRVTAFGLRWMKPIGIKFWFFFVCLKALTYNKSHI